MDFLAIGSASSKCPEGELPPDCHRHMLGYYTGKFVTGVEDMHLADIPKGAKIKRFFNAPLLIKGLDSSQVAVSYTHLDVYKRQDKSYIGKEYLKNDRNV